MASTPLQLWLWQDSEICKTQPQDDIMEINGFKRLQRVREAPARQPQFKPAITAPSGKAESAVQNHQPFRKDRRAFARVIASARLEEAGCERRRT